MSYKATPEIEQRLAKLAVGEKEVVFGEQERMAAHRAALRLGIKIQTRAILGSDSFVIRRIAKSIQNHTAK